MVDALGIVQTILSLVTLIKSAVDKVKQNERQCKEIARRVDRLGARVSSLNNNAEAVISALDDLRQAMDDALDVVLECQKERTVSRHANADKLSEKLRRANDSISEQMMTVMLVAILGNTTQQEEAASISCSKKFDLSELKDATDNFSEENVIGESASCTVYRGKLRDGTKVAVRSYSEEQQCQNEAYFTAKLVHQNIVKLLGYCFTRERCCLVYEYMNNQSLAAYINGDRKDWKLSWQRRFKIIKGIAQGVLYLHDLSGLRIIHLHLKPSYILLDNGFNPKISGFGISEMLPESVEQDEAVLMGTPGFQAPEYVRDGRISFKTDVYCFGILLLVLITGINCGQDGYTFHVIESVLPIDERILPPKKKIDERIHVHGENIPIEEIERCIHIALLCVEEDPALRPTMARVFSMLSSKEVKLDDPRKPVYTRSP